MQVKLRRPLDFLVVSDHAEYLGGYDRFNVGDPLVTNTAAGKQWKGYLEAGDPVALTRAFTSSMSDPVNNYPFPEATRRSIWEDVALTADEYNKPGLFTAFTGQDRLDPRALWKALVKPIQRCHRMMSLLTLKLGVRTTLVELKRKPMLCCPMNMRVAR